MQVKLLSPHEILPPLVPMRDDVDEEALQELAASIRKSGLLEPITVTPEGVLYRLVAGSRRLAACQLAGLVEIPAVIQARDQEGQITAMVEENLHRAQPTPLDEARVFAVLQEAFGKTVAEIAELVHKSRGYVAERLRILHGPEDVREALRAGQVSLSVALELLRATHDGDRAFLLGHALAGGATTSTVRRWVQEAELRRQVQPHQPTAGAEVVQLQVPETIMATCEWHRGQVPMDTTLSFRVCGDCFTFLGKLREEVAREGPDGPTPA
jgi:ParB family transcriptional regulator, chromosome partitioning protein